MQRSTVTLEFYTEQGNLMVKYNNKAMSFIEFFKQRDGERHCQKLYQYLQIEQSVELSAIIASEWQEILIKYILKHFPEKADPLDVIIHANGSITINKER